MRVLVLVPARRDAVEVHDVPRRQALRGAADARGGGGVPALVPGRERPGRVVVPHERVEREHQRKRREARQDRDAEDGGRGAGRRAARGGAARGHRETRGDRHPGARGARGGV